MNDKDTDLYGRLMRLFQACADNRRSYEPMWQDGFDHWFSQINLESWPCASKIPIPFIHDNIEKWVMSQNANLPDLDIRARTMQANKFASAIRLLIKQIADVNRMRSKNIEVLKQGAIFGTSFAHVPYRYESRMVKRSVPVLTRSGDYKRKLYQDGTVKLIRKTIDVEQVTFNSPSYEPLWIGDVWVYPLDASSMYDLEGVIVRSYVPLKELLEARTEDGRPMYKNMQDVKPHQYSEADDDNFSKDEVYQNIGVDSEDEFVGFGEEDGKEWFENGRVTLLSFWTDTTLRIIANGMTLIYDGPNPYYHAKKPFVCYRDVKLIGQFYGMPRWRSYDQIVYAQNLIYNNILDYVMNTVNPPWFALNNVMDGQDLRMQPGKVISLKYAGMDNPSIDRLIKQAETRPIDPTIQNIFQLNTGIIEESSGITKQLKGVTGGAKLATEAMLASQAINTSLLQQSLAIEEDLWNETFDQWIWLSRQFYTEDMMISMFDEYSSELIDNLVTPEILNLDYQIRIVSGSTEPDHANSQRRQKMMELITMLTPQNSVFSQYVKVEALLRKYLEEMNIDHPSQFIKTEEELNNEMMRQMYVAALQKKQSLAGSGDQALSGLGLRDRNASGGIMSGGGNAQSDAGNNGMA